MPIYNLEWLYWIGAIQWWSGVQNTVLVRNIVRICECELLIICSHSMSHKGSKRYIFTEYIQCMYVPMTQCDQCKYASKEDSNIPIANRHDLARLNRAVCTVAFHALQEKSPSTHCSCIDGSAVLQHAIEQLSRYGPQLIKLIKLATSGLWKRLYFDESLLFIKYQPTVLAQHQLQLYDWISPFSAIIFSVQSSLQVGLSTLKAELGVKFQWKKRLHSSTTTSSKRKISF